MTHVAWEATFHDLDLAALGWSTAVRSAPAELFTDHPDARPARVVRVDRGRMLLVADGSGSLHHVRDRTERASPRGRPHEHEHAVVGDWVLIDDPALHAGGYGFARALLPRAASLARRRDTSSTAPQVLAANVDLVLVAEALEPDRRINEARIARFVALGAAGGADVRVLLTGADRLGTPVGDRAGDVPRSVAGADAIATSVVDERGLDELRDLLPLGTTATIVGASGAGKSSIANALLGAPLLAVGERRGSGTGRHTTSVSRIVPIPGGGLLVDTPGIRAVGMHGGVDPDELTPGTGVGRSIGELAAACHFGDCRHDGEPGCAIVAAIDAGDLPADASATWRKLEREARYEQARVDERLRREIGTEWRRTAREVERARRRGEIVERRR